MLLWYERQPAPAWRARLLVLAGAGLLALALLASRLHRLQVLEHDRYARLARLNTVAVERVPAPRGRILDARGRLVVSNRPSFEVSVVPAEVRPGLVRRLAGVLGVPPGTLARRLQRSPPLEPLVLARDLSRVQLARVALVARDSPGVSLRVVGRRRYPHGSALAHVVGHMGEISPEELKDLRREGYDARDLIGKEGLDRTYDRMLRGRKGIRHRYVDPEGRTLKEVEERPPVPGLDLHLALDLDLQLFAEEALRRTLATLRAANGEDSSGAVVVLDVHTGGLLAMASLPQYDPRPFSRGIQPAEYRALLAAPGSPLVDRAAHAAFPPGSTFKPMSAAASLQEKVATPGTVFYCGGWYKGFHCFVTSGHGAIPFREAIALSCDVTFYTLADHLGIERLGRHLRAFGLGQPTGVDLPGEEPGLLPSPAWKKRWLMDEWYEGDTINMGIGQGMLLVTPLQLAVATAAIANGGHVVRPHLADYATDAAGRVVWRHDRRALRRVPVEGRWLQVVREGMRGAVTHGTGTAADSPRVAVAGKTGTAESVPAPFNPSGRNHVWFACFAPFEEPEVAVVVFLEKAGGYGGTWAAPLARQVLERHFGGSGR